MIYTIEKFLFGGVLYFDKISYQIAEMILIQKLLKY